MKYELFFKNIADKSESKDWEILKKEWFLSYIRVAKSEPKTCACGHYPIKNLCFIKNKINNNIVLVGNCCVKKFMNNIQSSNYFIALNKLKKDIKSSIPILLLAELHDNNFINKDDFDFYRKIIRERRLIKFEEEFKIAINKKILENLLKSD